MLVEFAGLTVDIRARYPYTEQMCRGYLASPDATPDFAVEVTEEEIDREADPTRALPRGYLESLAIYRRVCHEALAFDTFLFHGSALALDGQAYLFTAPSGTGKSTHTSLWRQEWGEKVVMVNDDKPLLRVTENGVLVCGTPWDGKHRLSTNCQVPLTAICLLKRGEVNTIRPVTAKEAYPTLLSQTYRPSDPMDMVKTLALLDRAMRQVKLYELHCNISAEAARVARAGMEDRK